MCAHITQEKFMYLAFPNSLYDFMLLENITGQTEDEVRKWISQSFPLLLSLAPSDLVLADFFFCHRCY